MEELLRFHNCEVANSQHQSCGSLICRKIITALIFWKILIVSENMIERFEIRAVLF